MLAMATIAVVPVGAAGATPSTGGAMADPSGAPSSPSQSGGVVANNAPAGSAALTVRPAELLGHVVRFRGNLGRAARAKTVTVERYDVSVGAWVSTASATAGRDGSFIARWRSNQVGRFQVRAVLGEPGSAGAHAASVSPTTQLTIYRPAPATYFGPGFYGQRTACGEVMTHELLGVAHRTLACGTPVTIFYGGHMLTVPVVDRGPYSGADWDLTYAAAQALSFDSGTIGFLADQATAARRHGR